MKQQNIAKVVKRIGKVILIAGAILIATLVFLSVVGTVVHAAGLVDDTVNTANEYSKYPLSNYQLDFYVDNSWDRCRGTGQMALESRSCMDFMRLPISSGQSVCISQTPQVTW